MHFALYAFCSICRQEKYKTNFPQGVKKLDRKEGKFSFSFLSFLVKVQNLQNPELKKFKF